MPHSLEDIASILHFHRKMSGLSRIELADLAGVGKTVIYDLEHGKQTVKLSTLFSVLEVLNISLQFKSPLMKQYEEEKNA